MLKSQLDILLDLMDSKVAATAASATSATRRDLTLSHQLRITCADAIEPLSCYL